MLREELYASCLCDTVLDLDTSMFSIIMHSLPVLHI